MPDDTQVAQSDSSTIELFQDDWKLYRIMVDNNYLFHREAYCSLHEYLAREVRRPFRFLDVACGDASASAGALAGTAIEHYHGVDFSASALTLAARNLAGLGCSVKLDQHDFPDLQSYMPKPADIVWIGLSLHHLRTDGKQAFMRQIRERLDPGGALLVYEDTSPDGEDRTGWLARWDAQQPAWTAYDERGWATVTDHVHAADFPETDSTWKRLGREAGFAEVCEIMRAPSDLFRLYRFSA